MSSGMKAFIIVACVLIILKHPEILNQLFGDLNQLLNG